MKTDDDKNIDNEGTPAEIQENLPNPALDLTAETLMSEVDRKAEWKKSMDTNRFCTADDCQEPDVAIEAGLALAVALKLPAEVIVARRKGSPISLLQYCYQWLVRCPHMPVEEKRKRMGELLNASGIERGTVRRRLELPQFHYNVHSAKYVVADAQGNWHEESHERAMERLVEAGLSDKREDGCLSEGQRHLLNIRDEHCVDAVLSLAGYPCGLHRINGRSVLVDKTYTWIETKEDTEANRFPHIRALVVGLFGNGKFINEAPHIQVQCFLAKLKYDRQALRGNLRMGGLAMLVAGEPGICKTFVLHGIIRPALGGRLADAYSNLSGKSEFNKEQAGSEVWAIDDANPFVDRESRRLFANAVKRATAGATVWVRAMHQDGLSLPVYRRLFIFTNTDSLDLMPEMEESLVGKIMLLKAHPFEMPKGCLPLPLLSEPAQMAKFQAKLEEELPYFLWYVDHHDVPECVKGPRFGLLAYKNPELLAALEALSHDDEVHYVIQRAAFDIIARARGNVVDGHGLEYEINALYEEVLQNRTTKERAKSLFKSLRGFSQALAHLKKTKGLGAFYSTRRSHGKSYWTLHQDADVTKTDISDAEVACESTRSGESTGNAPSLNPSKSRIAACEGA